VVREVLEIRHSEYSALPMEKKSGLSATGPTASTKSDGNVVPLAKDGFAATTHVFQKPGDYIVRVERANRLGQKAIAHLIVRVEQAR